eukprot:TRINITY_DN13084_c0_g1_i1.p1 TRINITY_DN13084_c0_g1~~TRINITY_DN13084_c0_g1_i1.p1  ORF type:complete len:224 (-),score=38.49 TRINITY_DN13084_c0_g1_i1:97-768(-)
MCSHEHVSELCPLELKGRSCKQATALFVYGTLKRGFANYACYLGLAEAQGKAQFVSTASTFMQFPMVVRAPNPATNSSGAPLMLDMEGLGLHVDGEVFSIDEDILRAMDILEGVHRGRYYRRTIPIRMGESVLNCVSYFFAAQDEELLALPPLQVYTWEHNLAYLQKPINDEIASLCSGKVTSTCSRASPLFAKTKSLASSVTTSYSCSAFSDLVSDDEQGGQ